MRRVLTLAGVALLVVSTAYGAVPTSSFYSGGWFDIIVDESNRYEDPAPYVVYENDAGHVVLGRPGEPGVPDWHFSVAVDADGTAVFAPWGPYWFEVVFDLEKAARCGIGTTIERAEEHVRFSFPTNC